MINLVFSLNKLFVLFRASLSCNAESTDFILFSLFFTRKYSSLSCLHSLSNQGFTIVTLCLNFDFGDALILHTSIF